MKLFFIVLLEYNQIHDGLDRTCRVDRTARRVGEDDRDLDEWARTTEISTMGRDIEESNRNRDLGNKI